MVEPSGSSVFQYTSPCSSMIAGQPLRGSTSMRFIWRRAPGRGSSAAAVRDRAAHAAARRARAEAALAHVGRDVGRDDPLAALELGAHAGGAAGRSVVPEEPG